MQITVLADPVCEEHDPGSWHPERAQRLQTIRRALAASGLELEQTRPHPATNALLELVHAREYVAAVQAVSGQTRPLSVDTNVSPRSVDAARLAAGSAVDAVNLVLDDPSRAAFCSVRPPGHHARRAAAMGFCLFNNVAVAAAHAVHNRGLARVMVLDPDVHHGNGTQEMFWSRRDVLFASIHRYGGFFPGTGAVVEAGDGPGQGYTVNCPLAAGAGDRTYLQLAAQVVVPLVQRYCPQLLLISAGFDAHELEQEVIGGMQVSTVGFVGFYAAVLHQARAQGIPFVLVLEGGYDLDALQQTVPAVLGLISRDAFVPADPVADSETQALIQQVRDACPDLLR